MNQNNIVDKTENNFINSAHTKYLFKEKIVIHDETIAIKQVDNFSYSPQGIEVKFTTIQKLYNDIHLERENQTTLNDLHEKNIVMLADEAHHLNANTKSKAYQKELVHTEITGQTSKAEIERKGWEHTVIELILKKNNQQAENKNVLLEFTATIPENEEVAKKYEDKIICQFGLKEFLSAGYTKEINLISSTLEKKERILQALLFHWYRHQIALRHGIPNFKPVILFRSKTIAESKADHQLFLDLAENISSDDFAFFKTISSKVHQSEKESVNETGKSRTEQILTFIEKGEISYAEIAHFIKNNFSERAVIITNSKDGTKRKEKTNADQETLLNSLEDKNNHIRAIFTVNRLTEGWDVLNLFDIVRLYEGRDEAKGKAGKRKTGSATTAEKQLIGRGVRYFPFEYQDKIKNKRKFDEDLDHELRFLEELFFYSTSEHRYIDELKRALKEDGFIRDDRIRKTFRIKDSFKKSGFYKSTKVWHNKPIDNPQKKKKNFDYLKGSFSFEYKSPEFELIEEKIELSKDAEQLRLFISEKRNNTKKQKLKDFERHIVLKALNIKAKKANSFYQFKNLKESFEIESVEDFLGADFLGALPISIITTQYSILDNQSKLDIILRFLEEVEQELKGTITPKIGGEFVYDSFEKVFGEEKTKTIKEENLDDSIAREKDWYVLDGFAGTNEEKELINFIQETSKNLLDKYDEIYLLRNEEVYKIYDFAKARGFQPDFILFLKGKEAIYYQIFIEPKGNQFVGDDGTFKAGKEGWKEVFLEEISAKYGLENIIKAENKNYKLLGLPFFNEEHNDNFREKYQGLLG
ncbi:MAG: type III restriction endonuclease [Thermoproteota archaeon]|nr:MAG: type III restriction endonuclease [Candidatus Korarchaeota archaeon]